MGSIKPHIATSETIGNVMNAAGQLSSGHTDLAAFTVQLRSTNIVVMGAYCRAGNYRQTLRQAADITRSGATPFIILADWNEVPANLEDDELLQLLEAEVVRPPGSTCHQAPGGRSIIWLYPRNWHPTFAALRWSGRCRGRLKD